METQRVLKPSNKVLVIADYREKEVIENLKDLGVSVNELSLDIGDFVCSSDGVVVERKTHNDFVSSIADGRIFEQLSYLKENYERPVIIVEGMSNREISQNALRGTIASLITKFNASFINTKNPSDTAHMIYWLAKKEQENVNHTLGFKQGKKPKDMKKLQEFVLSSVPGISNILASRILEKFGNIENAINASELELSKVKGMGKKLSRKVKKLLTEEYI
jgi:DNA excision repair protein ERCC-4